MSRYTIKDFGFKEVDVELTPQLEDMINDAINKMVDEINEKGDVFTDDINCIYRLAVYEPLPGIIFVRLNHVFRRDVFFLERVDLKRIPNDKPDEIDSDAISEIYRLAFEMTAQMMDFDLTDFAILICMLMEQRCLLEEIDVVEFVNDISETITYVNNKCGSYS